MDRASLAIFIHEIRNQCLFTEAAFSIFNQSLEQQAQTGAFLAAQSVLLTASQISGTLWPTRARSKKRGETLREVLQLPEKHPLNDKRLTEIWEHSDEKLEEWIGATKGQHVIFDHLGPLDGFTEFEVDENNIFRMYDPTTTVYYFRGDGFKLKSVADAIADIYSRVNSVHRQMLPEQHASTDALSQMDKKALARTEAPANDAEAESAKPKKTKKNSKGGDKTGKPPAKERKSPTKKKSAGKKAKRKAAVKGKAKSPKK